MVVLGGWASYVVVDQLYIVKAIRENVYVVVNILCVD